MAWCWSLWACLRNEMREALLWVDSCLVGKLDGVDPQDNMVAGPWVLDLDGNWSHFKGMPIEWGRLGGTSLEENMGVGCGGLSAHEVAWVGAGSCRCPDIWTGGRERNGACQFLCS